MKRRPIPEINAGSMADIAFLLLIFWLVTTTIEADEGIKRQLPAWVDESVVKPQSAHKRNIFEVVVNLNDELLVEGEEELLENLTASAKAFLVANGDGVIYPMVNAIDDLPIRELVRKQDAEEGLQLALQTLSLNTDVSKEAKLKAAIHHWESILLARKYIRRDFSQLPKSAHISVRNDAATTYDVYVQVQNELERAINDLRDELSLKLFNETFKSIELLYEADPEQVELLNRIYAIRAVYPYVISEALQTEVD